MVTRELMCGAASWSTVPDRAIPSLWLIPGRYGSAGSSLLEILPVASVKRLQMENEAMTEKPKD